jgi:hypothetical protein
MASRQRTARPRPFTSEIRDHPGVAAGYSKTPLWKKLALRPGDRLLLLDAPRAWSVGELPDGVRVARERRSTGRDSPAAAIIAFFRDLAALSVGIPATAPRIFPDGGIWAAWPRRAGGHQSDIRDQDIRDIALPLGLVDVKVVAIDQDWSGLRLVWRRELRDTAAPPPRSG